MSQSLRLQGRMNGDVELNLWAGVNDQGDFTIEGLDLGPLMGFEDLTEHEWITTVRKENVPSLVLLLGGDEGDDLMSIIERDWLPIEGRGLERLIRDSDVPSEFAGWFR